MALLPRLPEPTDVEESLVKRYLYALIRELRLSFGAVLVTLQDYAYLPGRIGGQELKGGAQDSEDLTLTSTSSSTKGSILLGDSSEFVETTDRLGLGVLSPSATLELQGGSTTQPPLVLNTGPLTTTPVTGAIEFNDGHWYVTSSSQVRQAIVRANALVTSTTTVSNTATETTLYTKVFQADELHEDELLHLKLLGTVSNASASDDFTLRLKLNGTTLHTIIRAGGNVTNAGWMFDNYLTVRSAGASGTFIDHIKYEESGIANISEALASTTAVDTTVSNTLSVTLQWDNAKAGNTFSVTQGHYVFTH